MSAPTPSLAHISGVERQELELLVTQIWPAIIGAGGLEVREAADDGLGVAVVASHRIAVWRGSIVMLLPEQRIAGARSLASYGRLRPARRRLERRIFAAAVLCGVPPFRRRVILQADSKAIAASTHTVIGAVREGLRRPDLDVAMSLRRTANRKALLQVVGRRGETVGFAKMAWNEASADGIRAETSMLRELDGGSSAARFPRVLLEGQVNGYPYLVTEPLPQNIRMVSDDDVPPVAALAALCPILRNAKARDTAHVAHLHERFDRIAEELGDTSEVRALHRLLRAIEDDDVEVPVAARWHGDFSPWNVGRTPDGTLWCWDFENSERDAAVGLDVLHWHASRLRTAGGPARVADGASIRAASGPLLRAFGVGPTRAASVHAVYAAEIVTRTLEAVAADGWSSVWASPGVVQLIAQSAQL